jgi:hypothetical protein
MKSIINAISFLSVAGLAGCATSTEPDDESVKVNANVDTSLTPRDRCGVAANGCNYCCNDAETYCSWICPDDKEPTGGGTSAC